MSRRLQLFSVASRLFFKQGLARIRNMKRMRVFLDTITRMNSRNPKGAEYEKGALKCNGQSVPVVWVNLPDPSKKQVLLYIHGGGFIFGSADTHKHLAADIAGQLGIKAVLPNYALAPEHMYPKGFEDIVTCYRALLEMGYDGRNIILGGDSAGGNFTFALLAYIKAQKLEMPACAFTFAALTDLTGSSETLVKNAKSDCVLPAQVFDRMKQTYAPDQDLKSPYLSPLFADLSDSPPILMQASSGEILLDDSRTMLAVLKNQGVDAQLSVFDNGFHVFQILRGLVPEADQAISEVVAFVKQQT
jgi:epsilon-lactone hydrolase